MAPSPEIANSAGPRRFSEDVIGVLKELQEVSQIVSKSTQTPFDKRELTLVNDSGYSRQVDNGVEDDRDGELPG
jgi:hypothetical protein